MEILEAYDLTGSYRSAAELAGCDHHTVRRYVERRGLGQAPARMRAAQLIDPFVDKVEEWVDRSRGKIRADVVHDKLVAMGYEGSQRTTRRAVAQVKRAWRARHRRVFRPWIPEPGLWLQFDWAEGPRIRRRRTFLWCAWLAWSRFRVVIPTWDTTLATVTGCLDATLRRLGGVPTYVLTDNEKTVTSEHVAGLAVRHPEIVAVSRHYGMTVKTCLPADPQSKGGSEATVRIAKADLVPTEANLREHYPSFGALEGACREFCDAVNARVHRATGRVPAELLVEERTRLHRLPAEPYASALGQTRRVMWDATISVDGARYSVPHQLIDARVWVRWHGDELVITHVGDDGPTEIARHQRASRLHPSIKDEHYPPRHSDPLHRQPSARTRDEADFLALGDGAAAWVSEAAETGVMRIRAKMAHAVTLAKLHGTAAVDRALGTAAVAGRFAHDDLDAILDYQAHGGDSGSSTRASETHSLQPGTAAWHGFGTPQGGEG
ncbi:IS21 family transposase [Haloechinothrix salitolerans]